jgi:hypothetical protein
MYILWIAWRLDSMFMLPLCSRVILGWTNESFNQSIGVPPCVEWVLHSGRCRCRIHTTPFVGQRRNYWVWSNLLEGGQTVVALSSSSLYGRLLFFCEYDVPTTCMYINIVTEWHYTSLSCIAYSVPLKGRDGRSWLFNCWFNCTAVHVQIRQGHMLSNYFQDMERIQCGYLGCL